MTIKGRRRLLPPIVFPVALFYSAFLVLCILWASNRHLKLAFSVSVAPFLLFIFSLLVMEGPGRETARSGRFSTRLFLGSLILRVIAVFVLLYVFDLYTGSPFEVGYGKDDHSYHLAASRLADRWRYGGGFHGRFSPFYSGYVWFNAALYYLLGPHTIVARLANALIGSLNVLMVYKIAREALGEQKGRISGLVAAVFPLFLYYSATAHKDTVLCFLLLAASHLYSRAVRKRDLLRFLAFVSVSLLTVFFRAPVFLVLLASAVVGWYLHLRNRAWPVFARDRLFALVVLASAAVLVVGAESWFGAVERLTLQISQEWGSTWSVTQSRFSVWLGQPLYAALGFFLPLPVLFESPQPSGHPSSVIYKVGIAASWNFLSFFVLVGLKRLWDIRRTRETSVPAIIWFTASFALAYSAGLVTHGAVFSTRHKLPVLYAALPFAAMGLEHIRGRDALFLLYVLVHMGMVLALNYVRLAGRGLL